MGQVLVRNLEDDVIDSFKLKAELNGNSLEQELRKALKAAAPLTRGEKMALTRKWHASMPPLESFDVRAAIRFGRDDEFL